MPVYFVTGKLGGGKSLMSVARIKEALERGVPVATNMNVNLKTMLGRKKKKTILYRIPDKPSLQDLKAIGTGNKTYDEEKNGLLVLDECGTWFNSRTWNDKSRSDVINWFLHARKLGWDIIFIVQDISIVDKQARLALAEHVVYCRRTDRATIPFIGSLYKMFFGKKLPLPKVHIGIVKYGDGQQALTVDRWVLKGTFLYSCYDTKQAFSADYDNYTYRVLPPFYTHGRYSVKYTIKNIMRITKIYFKKYSRIFTFTIGGVLASSLMTFLFYDKLFPVKIETEIVEVKAQQQKKLSELLAGFKITSFANFPNQPVRFTLKDKTTKTLYSDDLNSMGFDFDIKSRCHIIITDGNQNESVYCS